MKRLVILIVFLILFLSALLLLSGHHNRVEIAETLVTETFVTETSFTEETTTITETTETTTTTSVETTTTSETTVETTTETTVATTEETTTAVVETQPVMGDHGRLEIDGITSVAIDFQSYSQAQAITDKADYAYCWEVNDCLYIADHNTQNFSNLDDVQIGTTARIINPDGSVRELTCTYIDHNGVDGGNVILLSNGDRVHWDFSNAVICYTCAYAFEGNRYIVVFQ